MHKKTLTWGGVLAALTVATSASAFNVNFSYSQSDATTGSGTISGFTYQGRTFNSLSMPAATVFSPGAAPAGYVGSIVAQSGAANEANQAVGLLWSGMVTATATDGSTININLRFVPKVIQTPTDINDYQWGVSYGDNPGLGNDVSGTGFRFAMYLSRDTTIDAAETPNTFQRYTQLTQSFVGGVQDNFTNADTTNTAIKDAMDGGNPAGTDAVGRNLEFYWAWRDGGTLPGGTSILVDQFNVSGLLEADELSFVAVPEPSTWALLGLGMAGLLGFNRRRK